MKKDQKKAVEWYTMAAEQGDAAAQYNLGLCYANGHGVKKNIETAVEWFNKAANQGDSDAIRALREYRK